VILLSNYHPTVLYHVTRKRFLPRIRREGLKPHVPGKVWGACDASAARGKRVVWLTADPTQWKHDKHHRKSWRDPDAKLLRVVVSWDDERLHHYLSWRAPKKKELLVETCPNNMLGWFVYFGKIPPRQIMFPKRGAER
jgi:hypothetical protein